MDDAIARAGDCVIPAYESGRGWLERMRLSIAALLAFIDADRPSGWLLIVSSLGAGPRALERRQYVIEQITKAVDSARGESRAARAPSTLTAEGIVGGALAIVHARIVTGSPVSELRAPLTSMIAMPYLGVPVARRELDRQTPKATAPLHRAGGEALRDLGMRLTYRTVRVLQHLAQHSGSSNRQVGIAAGIHDQGQVSKLLARLQRLGLVENVGGPPTRGAANAWQLTPKGCSISQAVESPRDGSSSRSGVRDGR